MVMCVTVVLRLVGLAWLCFAVKTTLRKYRSKRGFYRKYWYATGVWFLWVPFIALLNIAVPAYSRTRSLAISEMVANLLAQFILISLYDPCSSLVESFPFHMTATGMLQTRRNMKENLICEAALKSINLQRASGT